MSGIHYLFLCFGVESYRERGWRRDYERSDEERREERETMRPGFNATDDDDDNGSGRVIATDNGPVDR